MHRTTNINAAVAVCETCGWNVAVPCVDVLLLSPFWYNFLSSKVGRGGIHLIYVDPLVGSHPERLHSRVKLDLMHLQIEKRPLCIWFWIVCDVTLMV